MTLTVPIAEGTYVVEHCADGRELLLSCWGRRVGRKYPEVLVEDASTGETEWRPEHEIAEFDLARGHRGLAHEQDLARMMRTNRGCRPE